MKLKNAFYYFSKYIETEREPLPSFSYLFKKLKNEFVQVKENFFIFVRIAQKKNVNFLQMLFKTK